MELLVLKMRQQVMQLVLLRTHLRLQARRERVLMEHRLVTSHHLPSTSLRMMLQVVVVQLVHRVVLRSLRLTEIMQTT
jgi:hypothetical protein